jgi:outer membrane protein assembly factor BamB
VTISSEGTILYDDNGEVLWKSDATRIKGKKVIPPVPRYGSIAEFEYEQRNLLFYDENGTFIKKVDANVTFLESYNGSLFVIVAYMGYSKSKGRGIYKLISYNTSGDKLWEHEASAFEIKISPNGKYIFPSLSGKYFKIYTNTGELLDEIVFPYSGINVAISPDNKFAIISTTYEIYMYEIETKELKWKYDILTDFIHPTNLNYTEEEWREKIIIMRARAIDTSVNAEFTVFGIDGGYVRLLNNKGERIWQTKVEGNYTIVFKAPIVKISRDGQNIIIYTKHNLYYFKINEK